VYHVSRTAFQIRIMMANANIRTESSSWMVVCPKIGSQTTRADIIRLSCAVPVGAVRHLYMGV
jgi:hypothetical protein